MTEEIDRDFVASPPASIASEGYVRCLGVHVRQATAHFGNAFPSRGLSTLFKPKIDRDQRERLAGGFEAAYRKLVADTSIALAPGEELSGVTSAFRPVSLFVTNERSLILPEAFRSPQQRSNVEAAEGDAETVVDEYFSKLQPARINARAAAYR